MRLIAAVLVTMCLCGGAAATSIKGSLSGEPCAVPEGVQLTEKDRQRISHLVASRTRGLGAAASGETAADRAVVSALFEFDLTPISEMPTGAYQCRTIKMGGMVPLAVYKYFRCEVGAEDAVLTLLKTTGSQRLFGPLTPAGGGLLYRGALHYGYEPEVVFYGTDPQRDQVGCLTKISGPHPGYLLELPSPAFESEYDVLELVPAN